MALKRRIAWFCGLAAVSQAILGHGAGLARAGADRTMRFAFMLSYRAMEQQLVYDSQMSAEWLQERLEMEIEDTHAHFTNLKSTKTSGMLSLNGVPWG